MRYAITAFTLAGLGCGADDGKPPTSDLSTPAVDRVVLVDLASAVDMAPDPADLAEDTTCGHAMQPCCAGAGVGGPFCYETADQPRLCQDYPKTNLLTCFDCGLETQHCCDGSSRLGPETCEAGLSCESAPPDGDPFSNQSCRACGNKGQRCCAGSWCQPGTGLFCYQVQQGGLFTCN